MKIKFEIEVEIDEDDLNISELDQLLSMFNDLICNLENEGIITNAQIKDKWTTIKEN